MVAKIGVDTAENEPSKVSPKWGVPSGSFRGHEAYEMPCEIDMLDVDIQLSEYTLFADDATVDILIPWASANVRAQIL